MKLKKFLAVLLCAATLAGSLPALSTTAAAAAGTASSFPDISDPAVAEAAEFLRLLGILKGMDDGTYQPNGFLTRAQFCRLAVDLRGEGAQAAAYERYTYFTDVKGDHWARGYINFASRILVEGSQERLVGGVGDGSFQPDRPIKQSEAITMVLRLLGYSQQDVGMGGLNWYDGYVATARALGLLEGITLSADQPLTRGEAALLFRNLLYTTPKAGGDTFFASLGGKVTEDVILLSVDAVTQDGTPGAVMVRTKDLVTTYKTEHAPFDASLLGSRVTLIQDKDGKVLDMEPSDKGTVRQVILAAHEVNYITTAAGDRLTMEADTPIYRGENQTTYGAVYMDLRTGSQLTFAYDVTGKLEYIYIPGEEAATQEAVTRVTCVYEDAAPSPKSPLTVTVLGGTELTVLTQASEELSAFKPGDPVTLFLTAEGKVAGAAKPANDARSTLVGVVTEAGDGTATVKPVADLKDAEGAAITFSGKVNSSAEKLEGELVILSSTRSGYLTLTAVPTTAAAGALNVSQRTLGGQILSDRVALYERTLNGAPQPISWSQITVNSIPASKISYVGTDLSGAIDIIILSDVTGDGYTYGYMSSRSEEKEVEGLLQENPAYVEGGDEPQYITGPSSTYYLYYIKVTNSSGDHELRTLSSANIRSTPGGMAAAANGRVGSTVTLTALTGVPRSAFNVQDMTVTVNGVTYPVAQGVECYNKTTGNWFGAGAAGLNAARAYAETMTLYYDKAPSQGGKIRLIVVG